MILWAQRRRCSAALSCLNNPGFADIVSVQLVVVWANGVLYRYVACVKLVGEGGRGRLNFCAGLSNIACVQLMVGAGGAAGGLWVYEHRLRAPTSGNSQYHELSMDTGF